MEQADRFNEGKCRLGMIPLDCHKWEADGFAYGARKYGMIFADKLVKFINKEIWKIEKLEYVQNAQEQSPLEQKDYVTSVIQNRTLEYVSSANLLNQFKQEECVSAVMINGSKIRILTTSKNKQKMLEIEELLIKSGILLLKKEETTEEKPIQNISKEEENITINATTIFQQKKLIDSNQRDACYVENTAIQCMLTIVMTLEDSEVFFVVNATTVLDSLTTLLLCLKKLFNISVNPNDFYRSGSHNWRRGLPISEQIDSLLRHLNAFFNEYEDIDPESGVHHLGLAQCNLAMMVNTLINHPELDDRFKIEK